MKASSFNEMTMHIKNVLAIAVGDSIIADNPYYKVQRDVRRKQNVRERDKVPTIEDCERIVDSIRGQEFAETADRSADMVAMISCTLLPSVRLNAFLPIGRTCSWDRNCWKPNGRKLECLF